MISIISSTNRPASRSMMVSRIYKKLLESKGATAQIIDLSHLPADFAFSALYHNRGKNSGFSEIVDKINHSDKFVFVVPEYNGSFPGVLKTFIDGLDFPGSFRDKKCAMVGISSGTQGSTLAISHLTDIVNYLGMHVLATKVRMIKVDTILQEGEITDQGILDLLDKQAQDLLNF